MLVAAATISGCGSGAGAGDAATTTPSASTSSSPPVGTPTSSTTTASITPTGTAPSASASTPAPATGSVSVTRTLAQGLNVPWGLARTSSGDLFVTSRDTGRITLINLSSGRSTAVGSVSQSVSNVDSGGEAGLLGIALSPRFDTDHQLFVYYSTASDNRIARFSYDPTAAAGHRLSGQKVILSGIPHAVHHNGGQLAFGPDGMLYASTGDASQSARAQDRSDLGGKILRMTADGKPASGNPFAGSVVWSYGHRNVQGLAWDSKGRMWASEFGDKAADELNLIVKGRNYGWPDEEGKGSGSGYTDPIAQWGTEEDSPSGIAIAGGSVWMAALKGQRLWRIPLEGDKLVAQPAAFLTEKYGRLRSVMALDDHTLLATTSNTDGRQTPGSGDDRILVLTVR